MAFLLFVLGMAAGSFINVLSLRYVLYNSSEEGIGVRLWSRRIFGGRSHCFNCGQILKWWEMVPLLSFIFLRGRCRKCENPLSLQYPLIELLAGLIFVFVPWRITSHLTVIWLIIFLLFLLLSIIDFRLSVIPDEVNIALGILGIVLMLFLFFTMSLDIFNYSFLKHYALLFDVGENIFVSRLAGAAAGMASLGLIIILSGGRAMGWGDFKLGLALGLIFGWPDILLTLALSFLLGGIVGGILLVRGQKSLKDAVPFGPFLALGATLVFFFGYEIINGYFRLFNLY